MPCSVQSRHSLRERGWAGEPVKAMWTSLGGDGGAAGLYPEAQSVWSWGQARSDAKDPDKEGLEAFLTLTFAAPGD